MQIEEIVKEIVRRELTQTHMASKAFVIDFVQSKTSNVDTALVAKRLETLEKQVKKLFATTKKKEEKELKPRKGQLCYVWNFGSSKNDHTAAKFSYFDNHGHFVSELDVLWENWAFIPKEDIS